MVYTFSAPLDFRKTLRYIGRFENDTVHAVRDDAYYHVLGDEQGYFLVQVTPPTPPASRGESESPPRSQGSRGGSISSLAATIVHGRCSKSREQEVARFMARTFGPDETLNAFYRCRGTGAVLRLLVRRFRGVRVVGVANLWECLLWSVIGQQVSVQSAFAVRSRVTRLAGAQVSWRGDLYEGFPTPQALLTLSSQQLRDCGFSRQKAEYARGIAEQMVSGHLDEDALCGGPPDAMREALLALRGIGPWSVEYAMMRMHADPDACPYEDIGLRNAVAREYGLPRQATMREVEEISEQWRPFRAYATFYLWQTLL
jgi:DNA-3-methyladenine glycosylase II